jgi:branched-chain amino acid aminotransferase
LSCLVVAKIGKNQKNKLLYYCSMSFILHNGKLLPTGTLLFSHAHRAFRYGDSFFESIRIRNGKPLFVEEHSKRLSKTLAALKMQKPVDFTSDYFSSVVEQLAKENGIEQGGRARLTFYRDGSGFYQSESNAALWILEAEAVPEKEYTLNEEGIIVGVFRDLKKSFNKLSELKSGNALLYVLASEFTKEEKLDDCLLLNDAGRIAEGSNANVFVVKDNVLYTPLLSEACLDGVMRTVILSLAKKSGIEIRETSLEEAFFKTADELWLTSASRGIRWVKVCEGKTFGNKKAKEFIDLLNSFSR